MPGAEGLNNQTSWQIRVTSSGPTAKLDRYAAADRKLYGTAFEFI